MKQKFQGVRTDNFQKRFVIRLKLRRGYDSSVNDLLFNQISTNLQKSLRDVRIVKNRICTFYRCLFMKSCTVYCGGDLHCSIQKGDGFMKNACWINLIEIAMKRMDYGFKVMQVDKINGFPERERQPWKKR